MDLRLIPTFAIIRTEFHSGNSTVAGESDAFDRKALRRISYPNPQLVIRNVDPRSRRDDEIWPPALCFVKTFRLRLGNFDAREPFHMFLAEITRHDGARGKPMSIRQFCSIHYEGDERGRVHCFLERNGVGVIIDAVQPHSLRPGKRSGCLQQIRHRNSAPNRVTHQAGVESVADAHQGRFLIDHLHCLEI